MWHVCYSSFTMVSELYIYIYFFPSGQKLFRNLMNGINDGLPEILIYGGLAIISQMAYLVENSKEIKIITSLTVETLLFCSSGGRPGSSVGSSMIPPYPGSNARARDRVQALQAYYQQQQPSNSTSMRTPIISGSRRSSNHRGMAQVGPVASSSDQTGAFYIVPPGSSGRNYQEAENPLSSRFHPWERDHLPSFSLNQVDRESGWGSYHQAASGSDSSIRSSSFRQRHGSERTSAQNRS